MDITNNKMVDFLANMAVKPNDASFSRVSKIKVYNMPSIPNNIDNWKVFENDKDILKFLLNEDNYHG